VPVHRLVTTREGGLSSPPFATLNLGDHVGDDPRAVAENRRRVAARVGLPADRVRYLRQEHGAGLAVVDGPDGGLAGGPGGGPDDGPPRADALVTAAPGLAVAVLVADCAPVLLADPERGVVGAVHAGRAGLVAGVLPAALARMAELGARTSRLRAWVGPTVCAGCYEVPAAMREEVAAVVPAAWAHSHSGTPAVDLRAGLVAELHRHRVDAVEVDPTCPREDPAYYSYRRDGVTGRFAAVVWCA